MSSIFDLVVFRRHVIEAVRAEQSYHALMMANWLRENDVLRAQDHRRRYEHASELVATAYGF